MPSYSAGRNTRCRPTSGLSIARTTSSGQTSVLVPFQALVERRLAAGEFLQRLENQVEVPGVEAIELLHAILPNLLA